MNAGSLAIQTSLDQRRFWIFVAVDVDTVRLQMVLDTGSPVSSIGQDTYDQLIREGLLTPNARSSHSLREVTIDGQPIADLHVRISRRVTRLGIDGLLGLDFLGRYEDIHFHVPSLRLTLSNPSAAR